MKALVDTRLLLQVLADDPALSATAREALTNPVNEIYFSASSLWEIAVKYSLGRLTLDPGTAGEALADSGFRRIEVRDAHLDALAALPWKHKDVFGRILVAQSIAEPMKLLTSDWELAAYGGPVLLV